jgi:YNFM family putative membrane transporter
MKSYIRQGSAVYWQAIAALFLGSFVTFATLYCTQPLIPVFSAKFHTSPEMASLSISFTTCALAIGMLVISWVSDAMGRRFIMAFSIIATAVLEIVVAFSTNFNFLLLVRALQGVVLAGYPAIAMAYINEEFEPANTGLVMGIYVSGNAIGGMLGRMIIGALTDLFSWHIALAAIGVLSLVVSIWFAMGLPKSRNFIAKRRTVNEILPVLLRNLNRPVLMLLYGIGFLIMGSFVALFNYIGYTLMAPPYNLSHTVVGFIFVVYLVGTVSSTSMGKLSDRIGSSRVLFLAIGVMIVGALITLHANLFVKILGVAVFTFGFFGSHSVASSSVGKCAGADKAQAASLYLLFYYIGSSVIGAAGGAFLQWYGWDGVVFLVGSALVMALLCSVLLFSPQRQICIRA